MSEDNKGKIFLRSNKQNNMYLVMIIIGVTGIIITLTIGIGSSAWGLIFIIGIFMYAFKNKPVLQFYEDYFEYKLGPLASLSLYRYDEIENVSQKKNIVLIDIKGRTKPVKINLEFFNKEDQPQILTLFDSLLKK